MYRSWTVLLVITPLVTLPTAARAQFAIDWYTVDGGGGVSSGGTFEIAGTIGQADAGTHAGGSFEVEGGFWPVVRSAGDGCPADLDGNGVLDLFDFLAFTNLFNADDPRADWNADGGRDLFDFLGFTNSFNAGC